MLFHTSSPFPLLPSLKRASLLTYRVQRLQTKPANVRKFILIKQNPNKMAESQMEFTFYPPVKRKTSFLVPSVFTSSFSLVSPDDY